jgi:hypothetical protein
VSVNALAPAAQADVLLSILNLLRFVLLRDRPTADAPAGRCGLHSDAERKRLQQGTLGPLLVRLEHQQAAMSRLGGEATRVSVVRPSVSLSLSVGTVVRQRGPLLTGGGRLCAGCGWRAGEQADWALTRLGVVEMVVQRLHEMLAEAPQAPAGAEGDGHDTDCQAGT